MSKKAFQIRPYAHERLKFVVASHIAGKRQRKFFETKKAAETYVHLKEIELLNQGREGVLFSAEDRVLAQRAAEILKPHGKTVVEAAEFYAKHLSLITASRKVSDVVAELHAARNPALFVSVGTGPPVRRVRLYEKSAPSGGVLCDLGTLPRAKVRSLRLREVDRLKNPAIFAPFRSVVASGGCHCMALVNSR